jgi:hypothetical protein
MTFKYILLLIGTCSVFLLPINTSAQGSVFTYQGRLTAEGNAVNGTNTMKWTVWDAVTAGAVVAGPVTNLSVPVSNGVFTLPLDFGTAAFTGADRWLEIGIGTNAIFITLSPRQKITRSPYAIMAHSSSNLLGTVPATQLTGALSDAQLSTNVAKINSNQTFTGANTFNNNVAVNGILSLGSSTVVPSDGSTLSPSRSFLRLNPANVIILNNGTAISNGSTVGSILVLQGMPGVNSVNINDGANVQLGAGSRTIGANDTLTLIWDGTDWIEIAYVNN